MEALRKHVMHQLQEEKLVSLWKEINRGIAVVAKAEGYQIVLGYGDHREKELLNEFPNVNRKKEAMDNGSIFPLYVHGSVDITQAVVKTLNTAYMRKALPAAETTK